MQFFTLSSFDLQNKSPWYFTSICDKLLGILWQFRQHGLATCGLAIAGLLLTCTSVEFQREALAMCAVSL